MPTARRSQVQHSITRAAVLLTAGCTAPLCLLPTVVACLARCRRRWLLVLATDAPLALFAPLCRLELVASPRRSTWCIHACQLLRLLLVVASTPPALSLPPGRGALTTRAWQHALLPQPRPLTLQAPSLHADSAPQGALHAVKHGLGDVRVACLVIGISVCGRGCGGTCRACSVEVIQVPGAGAGWCAVSRPCGLWLPRRQCGHIAGCGLGWAVASASRVGG